MDELADICAGCGQPYSRALGYFLHSQGCLTEDSRYVPPYALNRAHRWRAARFEQRWTPMRARMFRFYLLRDWPAYVSVWWRIDFMVFWHINVRPLFRRRRWGNFCDTLRKHDE